MDFKTLFTMQQSLDAYIQENKEVDRDVFQEKGLALFVELAELANETRCFKFWSEKGASEKSILLEEYVDSIHFILSLGIEKGLDTLDAWPSGSIEGELSELFLKTIAAIQDFLSDTNMESYKQVWVHYGAIAKKIGFSYDEIIFAYNEKNKENYKRQTTGY